MRDVSKGGADEGEVPVNPYSLIETVNGSGAAAQSSWLIFIGVVSYLLVAVAGVSHRDLLVAGDITLPILQVGIDLTRFFLVAPFVLVALHAVFVVQLATLARKAFALDEAIRMLEATDRRTHPLRLELGSFFLLQAIAGPERSRLVSVLVHGLAWFAVAAMPVLALLFIQIAFLPYHDEAITWAHRAAFSADLALLALSGLFLARPEPTFGAALSAVVRRHPVALILALLLAGGAGSVSYLVVTIPGEHLDRISRGELKLDGAEGRAGAGDKLFGVFERNLLVTDQDLIFDTPRVPGVATLKLRHRDLRFARFDRSNLHQADLTGANLDGASLAGADLRGARLGCADSSALILNGERHAAACASARGANLSKARLAGADLTGIDLAGALLRESDLGGATVSHVDLSGADLSGANLEKADLTGGTSVQAADLSGARLRGADLTGARMQGADLTNAVVQAVVLDFASLDGAALSGVDLEAASLYRTRMLGADLSGARIRAASLREAWIWGARVPDQRGSDLADLAGLRTDPPTPTEMAELARELDRLTDRALSARLRTTLAELLAEKSDGVVGASRPVKAAWAELTSASERATSDTATVIGSLVPTGGVVFVEPSQVAQSTINGSLAAQLRLSDRRVRLSRHLAAVACRARFANGAVATGIVRRALGPTFNGDPGLLLDALRHADCAAVGSIDLGLLGRLADKVEDVRSR